MNKTEICNISAVIPYWNIFWIYKKSNTIKAIRLNWTPTQVLVFITIHSKGENLGIILYCYLNMNHVTYSAIMNAKNIESVTLVL